MQIIVENHLGQQLELGFPYFSVTSVTGLTPSGAVINTTGTGINDGTFFNSSRVNQRNIVITIVPNGDPESARLELYKYFKPKYSVRLYFKTKYRDVYIDGKVETVDGDLYSNRQAFQVSVICPQPFFLAVHPTVVAHSFVLDHFSFPTTLPAAGITLSDIEIDTYANVSNVGEESTGVIIEMIAYGNVIEPTVFNTTTGQKFGIELEMMQGDRVVIDTRQGEKTVIGYRAGVATNFINNIIKDSSWFSLPTGNNIFTYSCIYGAENLHISYTVNTLYGGI